MTGMCNGRDGESGMQFGDGDNHGLDRRSLWREERGPVDQSVGIATDHPEPRADLPLLLNVEEAARLLGVGRTMLFALELLVGVGGGVVRCGPWLGYRSPFGASRFTV